MVTRRQLLKLGLGLLSTRLVTLRNDTIRYGGVADAAPLDPTPLNMPDGPLTTTPPRVVSKFGVHVVSGNRTGFGNFVQNCAAAGRPVAVVKCVGDFGAAVDAKNASPLTVTLGRVEQAGPSNTDMRDWDPANYSSAADAAIQYYQLVKPIWSLNPHIDNWETFNEKSANWNWQADFYIKLMDLAEADGYRLGLWSASVGNPPEWAYPQIARACQRARQSGNHILCLHEYGGIWNMDDGRLKMESPLLVTRYRQLYSYLEQQEAVIPLVISECGENGGGGFTGTAVFIDDFSWYDDHMLRDNYVIGCAAWTLGGWEGANFRTALPDLTTYVINKVFYRTYLPFVTNSG